MRDVTAVNDEFEVGFDADFDESWYRVVPGGRVVMVMFVLVPLAGLMGRGPFSHHAVSSPSGAVSVDLEPVARYGTPTQVTMHVRPPPASTPSRLGSARPSSSRSVFIPFCRSPIPNSPASGEGC